MDSADKLVNNRAPLKLLLTFVIVLAAGLAAAWAAASKIADVIISAQIRAMLSAAGGNTNFTKLPSDESVAAGEALLSKYGAGTGMDPRLVESWSDTRMLVFLPAAVILTAACVVWLVCSLRALFRIYDSLEDIRSQCIALSEDIRYAVVPQGDDFGCIRRVYDGIGLISERLSHLKSCLEDEKSSLSEFLTDFSHQMKTSVAIIRLNSDIIAETELSEQRLAVLTEEISVNISKMEELTFSALKLAKLNANAVEYKMEESPLRDTCALAIKRIEPLLRQKNIHLELKDDDGGIMLCHDRIWLSEAVENIIKNSADHSECTDITVSVCRDPVRTMIVIEDNGKGISQNEIPHLFERFGRKSRSTSMKSVGVGMSIAKKITEANGGNIIVYSTEGKGTRFELVFV